MADTKPASLCATTPPALQTALTVSHAYLVMQVETDPNGYPQMPVFDPSAVQREGIDISIFNNQDAIACFQRMMISGSSSLIGSWNQVIHAIEYFMADGNTDGRPEIITWGELAAGYAGKDPKEIQNAVINIKSTVGLLGRSMAPETPLSRAMTAYNRLMDNRRHKDRFNLLTLARQEVALYYASLGGKAPAAEAKDFKNLNGLRLPMEIKGTFPSCGNPKQVELALNTLKPSVQVAIERAQRRDSGLEATFKFHFYFPATADTDQMFNVIPDSIPIGSDRDSQGRLQDNILSLLRRAPELKAISVPTACVYEASFSAVPASR